MDAWSKINVSMCILNEPRLEIPYLIIFNKIRSYFSLRSQIWDIKTSFTSNSTAIYSYSLNRSNKIKILPRTFR